MRVAVSLSYLTNDNQKCIERHLTDGCTITIYQANSLKSKEDSGELTEQEILRLLSPEFRESKVKPLKLSGKFLSEFFNETESPKDIEYFISRALKSYMARSDDDNGM